MREKYCSLVHVNSIHVRGLASQPQPIGAVVQWWLLIEPKGSKWKPHVNIQAQQECSVPKQHNLHWYVELGRMLQ